MSQQQHVVKQSTSTQQSSSSVSMQQSRVQQQTQVQTRTVREVQQGVQRVQGPTQMMPVGLPPGASPPVFVQIFRNARFAQGGDAMFEGKVTGNPKPTVTWTRKGAQIASGNKYQVTHDETTGIVTLLITAIGPGDEGEYTCTAANQYGEAICTVYIQPEAAYMMQQQRQQQQSMQMSQSKSMMQQQHMSQQSFSQQQQQHMMSVQNGQIESFRVDTFEYRLLHEVEFRQSLTMRLAGEVEVEVGAIQGPPQAPQLQQKPRSTKVADGGNATFTVSVSGYPTPRVVWFKNGVRLQASDKYLMTQSAGQVTLVVKQVNSLDNGYYTMLAENNSGCTVASAQLAVVPRGEITNGVPVPEIIRPERIEQQQAQYEVMEADTGDDSSKSMEPKFVRGPTDREVQEGRMVRFDARVSGRPYPEVAWYINGVLVVDDATHKVLVNEAGNHSLMIQRASLKDAGIITCVARNKTGEATFQCQLNVLEMQQMVSPKFVERFQQCSVSEGETVVLQCRAVGTPTPVLSWQKDGVSVENTQNVMVQYDQNGASCLQILSAGVVDAGWYQCNAQNSAGSTATRARLHVKTPQAPAPSAPHRPHFPKPTKIIEPEPEPEPELIILRPVERAHHVPKAPEEEQPTEPPKFTHPLRDIDIVEGTRAHFEAKVIPVGDATMNIEWLIDGKPISASSRATVTYRFGFVALDILNVINADSGVYTCRATNVKGQAETSANLRVTERPLIESQTQHPEAMEKISYLEDHSRYQRTISIDESSTIKPTFVKPLSNLGEVLEGKYAHFEAQLHPVSDPFMRIEWFKDGKHITASSRINVIYNFGYVALNIMQLREEDSGIYTVRATNKAGECTCQASIRVISLSSVTGDLGIPEQAQHIKSVEEMEAYRLQMLQKTSSELAEASTAPVFKTQLKDSTAREGGYAHFEARLEPIGDPTLKVEWLKDGRPMEASSRITSFFNFGYVALTVKALIVKDAGTYVCRAYNAKGEAQVSCQLVVLSKTEKEGESQYEDTVLKMQYLEDSSRFQRKETEDVSTVAIPPKFLGPLKGTNKIVEGQKAHFEIRLEPQSDPTMTVEWYFNGEVIMSASRIKTYHDFGYVSLDISDVRQTDAGQYTVVARNSLGQAQMSTIMSVETRSAIDTTSMHEVSLSKTAALERRHQEPQYEIEELTKSKPEFTQPLQDPKPLPEGKNVHLEARLEPMNDPTMKVEWFFNGKPITIGSRFKTYFDFGFVALDILGVYTTDSGEYTCRAENYLGSAHTSSCVRVLGTGDIQTDTMHDGAMEQIHYLEDASRYQRTAEEQAEINQEPNFVKSLRNIETVEGTNIHLEARLQPVGDSSMRVEWFFNDQPLKVGHRFRPAYDFDYVALDLLSVYPIDSGIYTCRATNRLGQAVTSASVKVTAKKDLVFDSEHPESLQKLQYLDDSSRYQRRETMEEVSVKIKPRFLTKLKDVTLRDGMHAHFEAKIEPITDPNLRIEWIKDGKPIQMGSRFRLIHDFGYVALDISDIIEEDTGVYTCVATNLMGKDEISANLKVLNSSSIVMESQNQTMTMEQLQMLEDRSRYSRTEQVEETTKQAPVFTTSLKNIEILEGQRAHFEVRLIPTSDPTMKVEWFHNNVPVKSGSRFTEYNDFGFVALDIMYAYAEDSGTYTCRATNIIGQAVSTCNLVCHTKESILMETMNQDAMNKISRLESASRTQRTITTEETTMQAPVFTSPIKDQKLIENAPLHFEARLIPVGDPDLKVEWFKNNIPIQQANRISTMHDFGYVALDMKYVNPEDSGTYTCRATNRLGQAVTSATLMVSSKEALLLESQHSEALEKLRYLEDSSRYTKSSTEETVITQAPRFVVKLSGLTQLWEGQSAHVECRLEPYPDPSMKVEWFHNGKSLQVGHRFRTMYDFGFCAMDILQAVAEDSGTYEVRATNRIGTATSSINLEVKPKSDFIIETQHPEAMAQITRLEQKAPSKRPEDAQVIEKPHFGRSLRNQEHLMEGQAVHMEATLTPVNDPTMKVEWFFNGQPIPSGHRFRTTYDFGFVALDILYAYPEDSGTYMCKATNAVGQAVTSCSIGVEGTVSMQTETLDEQRLRKIRQLESMGQRPEEAKEQVFQKPVFTTPLTSLDNLVEGERCHLECRLEPVNDPNLKVEWFVNGVEIKAGHRFRTTHDFGYVALDILYTYAEDSGTYLCKATNKMGEAVNSCNVKVSARRSIYMDTQHPTGWEKIQSLEQRGHYERIEVAEAPMHPPRFTSELRGNTLLSEGQHVHLEGRIEPVHDPSMRVEWYHDGKALQSAARFHTTFDFGYVALDITTVYPEDSGDYTCRAFNHMGEATSSISFKVEGKEGVIYESARPEGLEKIRQLEDSTRLTRQVSEDTRTFQRPVFTQPLQNLDSLSEGETAHFECRLIPVGDPKLKVEWFRNEKPIETSSRINRTHDFGYVALDINGVRPDDEGIYMCRAYNDLGEAVTTASIKIKSHATIQLDTQHPEGMRKIQALEERKPDARGVEAEKVYDKPVFTTALTGPSQIMEGQNAHYECRVVPVGDPNMRYEWYCNGVELKMGSRFTTTHDFGFVTLDILKCVPEDSGVYMCKAFNKAGEAVSSCTTRVVAKDSILGDALHPGWETIRLRETQWNRVPETPTSPEHLEPPMFTKHLESHERLQEAGNVRLEAQVQPANDPNLSIEWFKNGIQLATGTRVRSTFDFGHVTLEISGLRENDSGIYTCKAVNRVGEAVSTCNIKVFDRDWLIGESVHPEALSKIAQLEKPPEGPGSPEEPTFDVPVFISHLNNVECREGDNAHFECRVEPSRDPTMKIEWFINGKPMQAAARYASTYDFGFVSLDCTHCYAEDSGIYMCRATNSKGSASTTGTLKCLSKANLYFDTQHPQGRAGLEKVEEAERAYWAKYQRQMSEREVTYPKPFFVRPLQTNFSLNENQALHMEANVEPKQDPDLKIEWFLNGKVLEQASRFKTSYDFGLVTLDLNDAYERDQGIYTCRAFNKAGEAYCTSTVVVGSKEALIESTQHPAGEAGLEAIQRMEEKNLRRADRELPDEEGHPPVFTTPFKDLSNLEEGEIAHFEAMLTPVGDQSMRVEWFFNGEPLKASHRVRTVYAFGMVVLEILGTKISDSGEYTCRASNKWGKAECSVTLECVDRAHGQPPKFTTHIQSLEGLKDGDSAHFECTLIPIGDPKMKVEWFHNGEPLRNATRIKTVSDFGFVVLDIAYLQNHDAGEWLCKASNKYGEDTTKAYLNCFGMGGVYTESLQPASLDKIAALEGHKTTLKAPTSPSAAEPPKFITQITNVERLVEGQSAHFEARLKPVNDPNLVVEWYKNGKKLPSGHRYRTFHDFGIVILDILYCYEEDSGEYEARAVNKLGEDKTTATLKCQSKTNLILTPQVPKGMEGGLQKLQTLEDSAWMRRDSVTSERVGMAPKFTVPLSNIDSMKEGENAHFEARLVPTDDPRLKVEWYWNGKPMKYSSRIRQFCDFGFVIMEISPIYPEDSGEYMCRAYNDYGEAVTKATLKCEGKRSIILESQLPKSMQKGMERIAELEGLMIKTPDLGTPTDVGQAPQFITQPQDASIQENCLAHFECRLMPVNDPNLRVEWYHNGRPLSAGSRIKTINDFGYVILEMANCYGKDAGTYTCRAVNKHGEASVECKLVVSSKSSIILDPQATMKFKDCTQSIQKLEDSMYKKEVVTQEEEKPCPPRFVTNLEDISDLVEGQPAHFDCRVEPVGDPTMRIEWFHNGMPLAAGSRVHMMDDFGFVVLDLEWTFARDTGEYICRATNKWGQATTKAMLNVRFKHGVDLSTQLPQGMTAEKLKELERGPLTEKFESDVEMMPPKFTLPIKNQSLQEGERAFFEARVEPRTDPYLRVEWYFNGKPLQSGHRFRTSFEMGHVTLELLHTYPEDSGEYVCRAYNKLGEDFTRATLKSKASQSVVLQSQVPKGMKIGVDFATQMEETLKKYCKEVMLTQEDIYDVEKRQPPRFVTQIQDVKDLKEMEETKFDCQLAPVGDPNMKVEWFFNGRPLPFKNRFTPIYDFGYVALIMNWVFGEDSGEYLCRATNLWGMDETRATLKATGRPGVIYDSQIPKGMQSLEKIRELEASWQIAPETAVEEDKPRTKPEVLKKPESLVVQEGDWARFSIRVSGHPRPRVMWIVNGSTAMSGNRFKIWYDGMYHLDIPKTRQYDDGKVEVICRNSLGESYASCELKVNPRQDDYRAVLKNSPKQHTEETSKSYRKPEWVTRMEDLKQAMSGEPTKPKFTQEIVNSRVREMETITFTATFIGNPKPEITWYHDNKLIRQHASYQMRVRNDKAILTIVQARPEVKGEYSCRAVNSVGEAFTRARLEVIELTYEEKMKISDERYAAVQIQHAAEHMKEKERERAEKQRQEHQEAMKRLKQEKVERSQQIEKELEEARKNVWRPKIEEKKVKVFKTPKDRRVAEVYTNWKSPIALEENYPEIQPSEFAPNQIPGVKCFVKVSETSVKGEEVVREVAPQFFEDEQVIHELAKVHTMLKNNVRVNEIWSMFRAGEFKALQQPSIQTALVKICEHIGHQRNVSIVLAQETQEQAAKHPVGLKAFLRMVKHAKNIKPETLFKEVIPREMGKFSSTTQELTKVSQMINQGIETEEIIACCQAGKLPALKKPETQQPLINIVEKHGHSVMVAQVLVEEAYRDAKEERVLAERAWEVVHEQEMEMAQVSEIKTETETTPAPAVTKPTLAPAGTTPAPVPAKTKPTFAPEETKPTPVPEEIKPTPIAEEIKPTPIPEEIKPTPVLEEIKPTPVPEEIKPTPKLDEIKPVTKPSEPKPTRKIKTKPKSKPALALQESKEQMLQVKQTEQSDIVLEKVEHIKQPSQKLVDTQTTQQQKTQEDYAEFIQTRHGTEYTQPTTIAECVAVVSEPAPKPDIQMQATQQVTQVTQVIQEQPTPQVIQQITPKVIQETTEQITLPLQQEEIITKIVTTETVTKQPKEKVVKKKTVKKLKPQITVQHTEETTVLQQPQVSQQEFVISEQSKVIEHVTVQEPQVIHEEKVIIQEPQITQEVTEVKSHVVQEIAKISEIPAVMEKTTIIQQPTLVQQEIIAEEKPEVLKEVVTTVHTEKAEEICEPQVLEMTTVIKKPVVIHKETVITQQPESAEDVTIKLVTDTAKVVQEPEVMQETTLIQQPTVVMAVEEVIRQEPVEQEPKETISETTTQVITVKQKTQKQAVQQQEVQMTQTVEREAAIMQQQQVTKQLEQTQVTQQIQQTQQAVQEVQQSQQVTVEKQKRVQQMTQQAAVTQQQQTTVQQKLVTTSQLPKVDVATISSVEILQSASSSKVEVKVLEIAPPLSVKPGDQLRATATYVADTTQENAMHLVEGERVYIQESTNSDWWFVRKHLTLEQGYVPAKLLADEVSYTHYVQKKLEEKINKLPVFDKLKKGQKAEPPKMVSRIEPLIVVDGQEAQFVCKIQGTPRPNITWFRQTAIIKPSEEFQVFYSDDNTATLVVKEVFPEDAGMFTCVAKNQCGYASCSAELVVEGPISDHGSDSMVASRRSLSRESSVCDIMEGIPPTFANKPTVKTVEEGSQLEMDVRLVAIPEPEIIWKKDGQVVCDSQRVRIVKQKDVHAYRSIIIIKSAKKEDEGSYEILVKNREGEAKNHITLKVTAPEAPVFEEKFPDQTVEAEGTIRLVARIRGVPAPDVTWSSTFKRGLESCVVEENSEVVLECRTSKEKQCKWFKGPTELKPSKNVAIEQEGLTHRLVIHSATPADTGKYKCTFDDQSTFANLTVKSLDDFIEKVQDVEVQEREQAVLQVEVTNEKATVTWHKDGEEITERHDRFKLVSEGKTRKLVLMEATLSDEGEYTCVLGDQECTAELTVRELPAEIVRKMKDQVVSKGNRATMEVELTKGDAVITWYKDNIEIRFSDHNQLSIDGKVQRLMVYNCQPEDSGTYRAVVGRSECSATLKVELQVEGDFSKKLPAQMDVNFKTDATFIVEITKEYEVKWLRNGVELSSSEKYIIKKENKKRILIVKSVTRDDAYEYSCVLGNLKTSCVLNVVLMETAPKIEKEYQKVEVVVTKGKDAVLKVPFTATPTPKVFWYHKGQLLDTENTQKLLPSISEHEASITIKQVENFDCGEYRLKLCNDCGAAYADFTVKILDKPSQPGTPEPMEVTNTTVTLHWSVPKEDGGRVITNYIVEYMNKTEQSWVVFNQTVKITQSTTVVTNLTTHAEYCFRVSAVNEIGTSEASNASKYVKVCEPITAEPPLVKEQLQAIVTGLHQEVILRCVVTASPPPKIDWLKDGKPVSGITRYENFTATFTIKETMETSGGMYTCRASNEAGMAECSATVVIQEAPRFEYDENQQCQRLTVGEKWHVPIQVIGHPRPNITWARNDKALVSTPHIVIHIDESEGTTDIAIHKLALEDSAVYTLTAQNSAGRSQLSFNLRVVEEEKEYQVCALEVIEEEIKRERPAAPMGPLVVSDVSSSSLTLTWQASPYDGGMEITSYYIEKLEKTQKQWNKVAEVGPDVRSYTVTELLEGHEYFFRVFALNALGLSDALEVSETIVLKSPFDKPGPPIGPFDVSNITESSLLLHWDEPDFDGGSPITHYVLEKRESTKKAWAKVGQTASTVTEMEVTGLKKGTAYYFRVYAFNAVGQSPPLQPDEPITAGKKITPPSKPNSLQVIDVTTKTVTLAWAPPTTTGGADLMGYVIERRLISEKKWEKVDTVDASVTLYCVENLREKSEYEFRVFAENPVGLSLEAAMTEQVRLKTHATPPSPPTAPLEVRPTGPTSLMIEWGAPESDGGAPLLGYIIAIRDIKRTMWIEVGQVGANFTRLHIKELQEEHEYFVRVFARNEVGTSNPLETEEPVKVIRPADFTELPEDDNAPSLSYSTTETLSWMREAGMDADIYSYARGRLLNKDEYFFKVWHRGMEKFDEK
ncbi:hypothetical protein OTU49_016904 [Cherax quadricarinatus]|uniref:Titin n=1 Tax=Cherax quadricarinatus TaxID=27406 RepID=A0AAW0Y4Y0_CHEQU